MYKLNTSQLFVKRTFDCLVAFAGLSVCWWVIFIAWLAASYDTKSNGFFMQERVGQHGRLFNIIKIRTMRNIVGEETTVTSLNDPRITRLGGFLRRFKIDELPQLWNVLVGDMSLVGPRPDVPGFADRLLGDDRVILTLKPGITGPASLYYINEEKILSEQQDPASYNSNIIYPTKVKINKKYIAEYSFRNDIKYILKTLRG